MLFGIGLTTGLVVFCFQLFIGCCQERPEDWPSSYNVGPYRHIYPPTNLSVDQFSCVPDPAQNTTCPLFIEFLTSFGGVYTSTGIVPGVQVALDQINARTDLLQGYTLHYTLQDSQCERTTSLNSLHSGLMQPPTKIAVIGSGCSVATEATAEISHYYNVTQLSCCSSSTELLNTRRFPKHFQFYTAAISTAYGYFGIIQDLNWRKVSIIYEDENLFTKTMDELKRLLMATNVTFTETRYESDVDPFSKDPDARIYILSMYQPFVREILCKAYRKNINFKYPRNLFLLIGWYPKNWWIGSEEEQASLLKKYDCSVEQRKSLLPYSITVTSLGTSVQNYSAMADNGYTGEDIRRAYHEYLNASRFNLTEEPCYQLCYDTVWSLALALNNTLRDLKEDVLLQEELGILNSSSNINYGLQQFMYNNSILSDIIFNNIFKTNYTGIVGHIQFSVNKGRLIDVVSLGQYQYSEDGSLKIVPVATVYRRGELEFDVIYRDNNSIWPEGVPYDGVATESFVSVHLSVTIIFSILATCGLLFSAFCVVTNITFRNKRLIRLTSPYLNCLIGVGAIILYINMYLYATHSTNRKAETWLCNLDAWLTAIGYSLCYGTILAKMCRVYYIFNNPTFQKKPLKDWILATGVAFLVVVDVVILTIYTIIEGSHGHLSSERTPNRENEEDVIGAQEITRRYFTYVCKSKNRFITLGVLYGYKALLQIIALVLAISIRKVQVKGLNDYLYIIAAIYVTSIVTAVIVVSTYTLVEFINIYAVVFSLCLFIGTTVILGLVFIPPLFGLYRDPEGSTVFKQNGGTTSPETKPSIDGEIEDSLSLKKKIKELEKELQEMRYTKSDEKL